MAEIQFKISVVALMAFTISACSSATDSTQLDGDASPAELSETEVVAELNIAGVQVSFLQVTEPSGAQRVVLQEMAPLDVPVSPLRDLAMSRGLTALEVYLALSPDDEAPVPAALLEAHESQARGFGREDVQQVVAADFEVPTVIEKTSASCDNWVFSTMNGDFTVSNKQRLEDHTGIGRLYTAWTLSAVTLGGCNESATESLELDGYYIYQPTQAHLITRIERDGLNASGVNWVRLGTGVVPPGISARWYNYSSHPPEECEGFICEMQPTKYAVQGVILPGATHRYRLRTGHVSFNPQ